MVFLAGSRILEITVLSAEDLTVDRKPAAKKLFVDVRTESVNCSTSAPADGAGGNPLWNETMTVEMPAHARSITFEVKCKTSSSSMGAKSVGIARIALSDFLGGIVPDNCLQFLSYRLRDWEGRRNGIINFSVRVKSTTAPEYIKPAIPMPARGMVVVGERSSCGFQMRVPLGDRKCSNGAVIGIPIGWNSYTSNV